MTVLLKNNVSSTLATAISPTDTGIVVASGSRFPTITSGDYFYVTLVSQAGQTEIVKVTARVGNSMTVVRAQDGSLATSFQVGALVDMRVNVASIADLRDEATEITIADAGNYYTSGTVEGALQEAAQASTTKYNQGGTGAVTRTVQGRLQDFVSVKDFGAVGDGVTDDTLAIQKAVEHAINNKRSLVFPSTTYAISSTILIPNNGGITSQITIDGQGCVIRPTVDVTIFASARYSGGVLIPTYGEPLDVNFCFGIALTNFTFASAAGALLLEPAIEIQNWNTGCKLSNIISRVHDQFLKAASCFYCDYDRLWCQTSTSTGAVRFLFYANNNLNTVSNCVSADSTGLGIGFQFDGLVTALQFVNNSIEGASVGVNFNGEVRGASVSNCYGEGWSDVAVKVTSNFVSGLEIDGCYWNFGNNASAYLLDYTPGPSNNIKISGNNAYTQMPSLANLFKTVSTTAGYNLLTFEEAPATGASINDFLVDNTFFSPEIDYQGTVNQVGLRANVVNTYAKGNYAGKFTSGYANQNGFTWVNTGTSTLQLTTRIVPSATQLLYVNIVVNVSGVGLVYIKGQFVGTDFYEYNGTALTKTTTINVSTVSGFVQINGTMANTISTAVVGEVRLV